MDPLQMSHRVRSKIGATTRTLQAGSPAACKNTTEPAPKVGRARGPLVEPPGVANGRVSPSSDVDPWVEHYWWVRWDVAEPQVAEVLSYPSLHVTFEGVDARIVGVVRKKFTRRLTGRGEVFALKFRAGMFRPWFGAPVVRLTDQSPPLGGQLGAPPSLLLREIFAENDEIARAKVLEAHLRARLPPPDAEAELARDLVERVRSERELKSVAGLARASGLGARALQRLFREYVGVGPKWVVRRFRLQEAAELLATTEQSVGAVAAALDYFDQAHFVRDFKAVVGETPSAYVRRARATSESRTARKAR
jgi:AraC-like DNA-binding protein